MKAWFVICALAFAISLIAAADFDINQTCDCIRQDNVTRICLTWQCTGETNEQSSSCFSLDTTMMGLDGPIAMGSLEPGTLVFGHDGEKLVPDVVIDFLHYEPDTDVEMHEVTYSNGQTVWVSPRHLVFLSSGKEVFAKKLVHGTEVLSHDGSTLTVQSVRLVTKRGLIAPLTNTGRYIVDGAVVSAYAEHKSHYAAHRWASPIRMYRSITGYDTALETGIMRYARWSYALLQTCALKSLVYIHERFLTSGSKLVSQSTGLMSRSTTTTTTTNNNNNANNAAQQRARMLRKMVVSTVAALSAGQSSPIIV